MSLIDFFLKKSLYLKITKDEKSIIMLNCIMIILSKYAINGMCHLSEIQIKTAIAPLYHQY